MKKICIFILGLALMGCSSGTAETPTARDANGAPIANASPVPLDPQTGAPADLTSAPAPLADPASPADPAAANASNQPIRGTLADIKNRKFGKTAFENAPGTGEPPRVTPRPAPEDSEFTAVLQDAAVETRTFRSHPQLWKVEKRTSGKNSTAKVYLRDKRVIDVPGDKLERLATISSADILRAAGISVAVPAAQESKPGKQGNE